MAIFDSVFYALLNCISFKLKKGYPGPPPPGPPPPPPYSLSSYSSSCENRSLSIN